MSNNNEWLKEIIAQIDKRADKLDQRLTSIDETLTKQENQLSEHIFRTELAEENIALLREQIVPISKHIDIINATLKIIGGLSILAGMAEGVFKTIEFFSK